MADSTLPKGNLPDLVPAPRTSALRRTLPYIRNSLKLLVGCGLLFTVYMWIQFMWRASFNRIYGPGIKDLPLVYPYGAEYGISNPTGREPFYVLFTWIPLGGGALLTILAQRLPNDTKPTWMRKAQALVRWWKGRLALTSWPPEALAIHLNL